MSGKEEDARIDGLPLFGPILNPKWRGHPLLEVYIRIYGLNVLWDGNYAVNPVNVHRATASPRLPRGRSRVHKKANACELCGFRGVLDRHHIDSNPSNNERSNHITLCPNCHGLITRKKMTLGQLLLHYDREASMRFCVGYYDPVQPWIGAWVGRAGSAPADDPEAVQDAFEDTFSAEFAIGAVCLGMQN